MKCIVKIFSFLLLIAMLLSCFAACTPTIDDVTSGEEQKEQEEPKENNGEEPNGGQTPSAPSDSEWKDDPQPEPEPKPEPKPDPGENGVLGDATPPSSEPTPDKPQNPDKTLLEKSGEKVGSSNRGCSEITVLAAYNRGMDFDTKSYRDSTDKIFYLYLPCRADLSSVTFSVTHLDGSQSGPYTADFSDGEISDNEVVVGTMSQYAIRAMQSDLPTVMLQFDESYGTLDAMHADAKHETYAYGQMIATATDEMAAQKGWPTRYVSTDEDESTPCSMKMRGRGNATWQNYPKDAYQFVIENSINLFGMGRDTKYVLLANYNDAAGLRTELSLEMGKLLGVPYTADYQQVDVFVNGTYYGMYTLAEKVEVGESRVAIDQHDDILLEMDNYATKEPAFTFQTDYTIAIHKWRGYRVHSPETDAGTARAQQIIALAEKVLYTGTDQQIEQYFDLASWAKMYFVQLYTMNADAFGASTYFYYNSEDGKLYACAPWDFDWSFGVSHRTGAYDVDPLRYDIEGRQWIKQLLTHENFLRAVLDEYYRNGAKEVIECMPTLVDRFDAENRLSGLMNETSIPMLYEPKTVTNYDQAVAYVKDICIKRVLFIADKMKAFEEACSYFDPPEEEIKDSPSQNYLFFQQYLPSLFDWIR